jgi:hypothetical protein
MTVVDAQRKVSTLTVGRVDDGLTGLYGPVCFQAVSAQWLQDLSLLFTVVTVQLNALLLDWSQPPVTL